MSRVSLYETRWIDLVFENKNKEYGAYQLRHDSVKSSFFALFMGLLFVTSIAGITTIISYFKSDIRPEISIPDITNEIIHLTNVVTPETKKNSSPRAKNKKYQSSNGK